MDYSGIRLDTASGGAGDETGTSGGRMRDFRRHQWWSGVTMVVCLVPHQEVLRENPRAAVASGETVRRCQR